MSGGKEVRMKVKGAIGRRCVILGYVGGINDRWGGGYCGLRVWLDRVIHGTRSGGE